MHKWQEGNGKNSNYYALFPALWMRFAACRRNYVPGTTDNSFNRTVMNGLEHMEENLQKVRNMKFPKDIPVLQFLAENNCKLVDTWEKLHQEVITETEKSKLLRLGKTHYLHIEQREIMPQQVKMWIRES